MGWIDRMLANSEMRIISFRNSYFGNIIKKKYEETKFLKDKISEKWKMF